MTDARYAQYENLLRLLIMLEGRSDGIGIADIEEVAGIQRRAAERMRDVLLRALPQLEEVRDGASKRWRLDAPVLNRSLAPTLEDLAALNRAVAVLRASGDAGTADCLSTLSDRLRAALDRRARPSFEIDLEALLEADGVVHRPGPREVLDADVVGRLRQAILGGCWVELDMQTDAGRMSWRNRVGPIAFLLGEGRQYLVGFSDYRQQVQLFRLARLRGARVLSEAYERPEGFDLSRWLARSFGTWRDQPQAVEWRFAPHVAADVRQFRFHPDQRLTDEADGSVTVRFTASGLDEMGWHLFRWGDAVRVVAPDVLRERYAEMLAAAEAALDGGQGGGQGDGQGKLTGKGRS